MADRAQYMRVYRRTQQRDRLTRVARQRAQQKLLNRHHDEYEELVDEERKQLGLPTKK